MEERTEQDAAARQDDLTEAEAHSIRRGPQEDPQSRREPAEAEAHLRRRGPEDPQSRREPAEAEAHLLRRGPQEDPQARHEPSES